MLSLAFAALELAKGYAPYAKYAPMQVLVKTIREAPPSLKTYPDHPSHATNAKEMAAAAHVQKFSDKYEKFVARCLQKDPRARPSAHELLADPFLKKGIKNSKMVEALLSQVPSVGATSSAGGGAPGAGALLPSAQEAVPLVPGTTWVFPDELKAQLGIGEYAPGGARADAAAALGDGAGAAPGGGGPGVPGLYSVTSFGDEGDEDITSMEAMQAALDAIGGETAGGV